MATYVPGTLETDQKKLVMSLQQIGPKVDTLNTKTTGYEAAWTAYTPTFSSSVGSFTTASATGRYKQIGKTVFVQATVTITTAGTAAGVLNIAVPIVAGSARYVLSGYESATTGFALGASIPPSTSAASVTKYDGTTIIASGAVVHITGVYETA